MSIGLEALTTTVKTKIVATIGPASESTAMLSNLAHAGADVFRLNFAHGGKRGFAYKCAQPGTTRCLGGLFRFYRI